MEIKKEMNLKKIMVLYEIYREIRGRHDRDRMVVEFTTTCAISDLRQICGFLQVLWLPQPYWGNILVWKDF